MKDEGNHDSDIIETEAPTPVGRNGDQESGDAVMMVSNRLNAI